MCTHSSVASNAMFYPPQLNNHFSPLSVHKLLTFSPLIWLLWCAKSCGLLCIVLPHCNTFTDVEDVKFVINYDYPNSSEDYIHRIGRTARSQKTGTAYTFFTPNNMKQASDLISVLREANQAINPKLIQMAEDRGGNAA